ncbi:hypothetical protein GQ457_07G009050 [Hibiscus cannabinus]
MRKEIMVSYNDALSQYMRMQRLIELCTIRVMNLCKASAGREFRQIRVRNLCKVSVGREFRQIRVTRLCKAAAGREFRQIRVRHLCKAAAGHEFRQVQVSILCKRLQDASSVKSGSGISAKHLQDASSVKFGSGISAKRLQDASSIKFGSVYSVKRLHDVGFVKFGSVISAKRLQDASSVKSGSGISTKQLQDASSVKYESVYSVKRLQDASSIKSGSVISAKRLHDAIYVKYGSGISRKRLQDASYVKYGSGIYAKRLQNASSVKSGSVISAKRLHDAIYVKYGSGISGKRLQDASYVKYGWSSPLTHVGLPDCQRDFRLLIDKNDEFLWTPYNDPDSSTCVPSEIFQGAHVWMTIVPLINYAMVEWHSVDRVMRRFHCVQLIPDRLINLDSLHRITRQGKTNVNWESHHSMWIMQWADRYSRRPQCQPFETYSVTSGYFDWYVANGKPHILTPAEQQREIYARLQNRPPTHRPRRAQPTAPRRRRGNNTGESSSAPPQPQPPVPDQSTPIAPHVISAFQHMGSPSEGFFTNIAHPYMPMVGSPTPTPHYLVAHTPPLLMATNFDFGFIAHTPPHSLFYTGGPSGTCVGPIQATATATADDAEDDESTEDEDEEIIPWRNPARTRNPPRCGTGGHRHY